VTAPKGCINIHTDVPGGGANGARPRVVRSRRGEGEACVQKRVQSRAYAPPQCPPTRSPPISQPGHKHHSSGSPHPDTLGWVGPNLGPNRHATGASLRDTDEDHPLTTHVVSSRLPIFSTEHTDTPFCPTSCTVAARERLTHSAESTPIHPRWVHAAMVVPLDVMSELEVRKQQIGQLELLAAIAWHISRWHRF
jgi:hypothetical protein